MKAVELLEWVMKECQRNISAEAVLEKRAYLRSDNFFDFFKMSVLEKSYAEVTTDLVTVVEGHDSPNASNVLEREVNDGFWVYSFACSADYHEFYWCADEEEALEVYDALEVTCFLCRKYIIHTEKGVLLKCEET